MADPLRCPGGEASMGARHVLGHGGVAPVGGSAQMAGDALSAMENLDRSIGEAGPQLLSQQGVRHRVVMLVDLDVVVETGAALLPLGVDVRLGREIEERGAVELLEQLPPARSKMAGDAAIELVEELADGGVGLGQGEQPAVPELGQDPSLDDLDTDLDPRFRRGRLLALSRGLRGRAGITAVP